MRIITLLLLSFFLNACQQAFELPFVPDTPPRLTLPQQIQTIPIAFDSVTIDMPTGVSYLAYPYWRWQYQHLNMSLWDACNAQLRYRLFDSTAQWEQDAKPFGEWQQHASSFVINALTEMGYHAVQKNTLDTPSKKPALLLKATITRMRGNMCHTTPIPLLQNGGQSAGDIFVHIRWQLYDADSKRLINTFETESIGYVEVPQTNGDELVILSALKNAALYLGGQTEFADAIRFFQKNTKF